MRMYNSAIETTGCGFMVYNMYIHMYVSVCQTSVYDCRVKYRISENISLDVFSLRCVRAM